MPDVTLIPAIASFFGVSTDELFDFNVNTIEQNVKEIVDQHSLYWDTDTEKAAIQLNIAKNLILSVEKDFATPFTRNLYTTFSPRIRSLEEKLQIINK